MVPLLVSALVASEAPSEPKDVDCGELARRVAGRHLGPDGEVVVETASASARVRAYARGRLVWAGRVESGDCSIATEVAAVALARSRAGPRISVPVGEVPSLPQPEATVAPPSETTLSGTIEIGATGSWELGTPGLGRGGGALDLAVRMQTFGGRVELGAFAPRTETVESREVTLGEVGYATVHGLIWAEACPGVTRFGPIGVCASLGGGIEWLDAWPSGDRLFQQQPGSRVFGRGDGQLSVRWDAGRLGLSAWSRVTVRPDAAALRIEGADGALGLPRWTATVGVRGWFEIF